MNPDSQHHDGTTLADVAYEQSWGDYAPAIERHAEVAGRLAPTPTIDGKLSPAFVEWMMMFPEGWVTDPELGISRTGQLRCLGNAVVWPQAVAAWGSLLGIHVEREREKPDDASDTSDLRRQRSRQPRQRRPGPAERDRMSLIPTPTAWLGRRESNGDHPNWPKRHELSDFLAYLSVETPTQDKE